MQAHNHVQKMGNIRNSLLHFTDSSFIFAARNVSKTASLKPNGEMAYKISKQRWNLL